MHAKTLLTITLLVALFLPSSAPAVMGVIDIATLNQGKPLPEANFVISQGGKVIKQGKTNKQGNAATALEPGNYNVSIRKGDKTLKRDVTISPGKITHIVASPLDGRFASMPLLCPQPRASSSIEVGSKTKVGGGVAKVVEKAGKGLIGGLLGGLGRGGGFLGGPSGSDEPDTESGRPEEVDDPVKKKQKFVHPATGTSIMVGAMPTEQGILVSTLIENAPGNGTFQTVLLEDLGGRRMIPVLYEVYELYAEWTLTVHWTRDTYVDGKLVKHEEGGWSESGTQLLDVFTRVTFGDPIWQRLGFDRAVDGVKGLGTEFLITVEQLRERPVALVIHITRPDEDPVTTVPFVILMGAGPNGDITLQQLPRTPAEGFCNCRLLQIAKTVGEESISPAPAVVKGAARIPEIGVTPREFLIPELSLHEGLLDWEPEADKKIRIPSTEVGVTRVDYFDPETSAVKIANKCVPPFEKSGSQYQRIHPKKAEERILNKLQAAGP